MTRRVTIGVLAVGLALAISACSGPLGTSIHATFNGVSAVDGTSGTADMSVSVLDAQGHVLATGVLTGAGATVTEATSSGTPVGTAYGATALVCGDITASTGDITGILTLDATGSMASSDPSQLRADAAKGFVARMASTDRVAVASFDTGTTPTAGYSAIEIHQTLTSDKALLGTAIDAATFNGSNTNLWDAGVDSANYLAGVTGTNKIAVLLTDGYDNSSSSTPAGVVGAANSAGVKVFTVGLGSYVDDADLISIASQTGGTFAQVQDAADLAGLFDGVFNATQASGCIRVAFSPVPASGTTLKGSITFKINGEPVTANYVVVFP